MDKNGGDADKNTQSSKNISDQYKAAEDRFYEKLAKLNESSGLGLVFNFRDSKLDLLRFYNEVINRGGFYQVTKTGKWDEVASASNSNRSVIMSASQLQNIYEMLLFQYELMCCPKNAPGDFSCSSLGKRKHCDSTSNYTCEEVSVVQKTTQRKSTTVASPRSNVKASAMDGDAPQKNKTGYSIFLKLETNRLRMAYGESSNSLNLRSMAINTWRYLPEKEKQQYLEAGKMDKERYEKEMAAYKPLHEQHISESQISLVSNDRPSKLELSTCSETDDVYHVSWEADESKSDLGIDNVTNNGANGFADVPYPINDEWIFI